MLTLHDVHPSHYKQGLALSMPLVELLQFLMIQELLGDQSLSIQAALLASQELHLKATSISNGLACSMTGYWLFSGHGKQEGFH